jgi:DnaJ-class molecular chaperone
VITVPGKGVQFPEGSNKSGDLILTVKVLFPKKLTKEQNQLKI